MAQYPFRSALVTGASSGIGEDMVRLLAADGVSCVVVARRVDRLQQLADTLPGIEVLEADLLTPEGVAAVAARIGDPARPLDLVVNNAGFGTSGSFHTIESERTSDEIRLNVLALTQLSHAALASMVPQKRGWLLNVSSVASFQPGPGLAVYGATKAFVTSFSEAIHEEVRGLGVKVTALCPGLTKTEFQSKSNSEGFVDKYPKMAWLTSDMVARDGLRDCAKGKAISIPGYQYKGIVGGSRVIPRSIVRRIAGLATTDRQ
jgi:uncharacterized protein